MKRREWLQKATQAGLLAALSTRGSWADRERQRPNILYIFTDQQTATAMSCAGNRWVQTPGMDRIAARGVLFENAYCTQPLCGPSRTAMFTGLYPVRS